MRDVILKMHLSIDGFVGGPDGEVDWVFASLAGATDWTVATLREAGVHAMGRRTFADMIAWWPISEEPFAQPMNAIPKVVFARSGIDDIVASTTAALRDAPAADGATRPADPAVLDEWAHSRVASGDLGEEIAKLRAEPGGPILVHGGASFARSLVARGLIDEYRLVVHPVTLGRGLPLFADQPEPRDLDLVASRSFNGGAVALVYRARR